MKNYNLMKIRAYEPIMKEQFPPKKEEKESQKKGMKVERKDSPLKERRVFLIQGKKNNGK